MMQWLLAALLQSFIASYILLQCSGKVKDKDKKNEQPAVKKPEAASLPAPAKKEEPKKDEAPKPPATAVPAKPEEKPKTEPPKTDDKPKEEPKPKETTKSSSNDPQMQATQFHEPSLQLQATQAITVRDQSSSVKPSTSMTKNPEGDPKEVQLKEKTLKFKTGEASAKLQIKNLTDKPLAFKLKCSDNVIYKFKPVFFLVKPKEQHEQEITRKSDEKKPDKLIVVYTPAGDSDNAKKIYEKKPPAKEFTLALTAT